MTACVCGWSPARSNAPASGRSPVGRPRAGGAPGRSTPEPGTRECSLVTSRESPASAHRAPAATRRSARPARRAARRRRRPRPRRSGSGLVWPRIARSTASIASLPASAGAYAFQVEIWPLRDCGWRSWCAAPGRSPGRWSRSAGRAGCPGPPPPPGQVGDVVDPVRVQADRAGQVDLHLVGRGDRPHQGVAVGADVLGDGDQGRDRVARVGVLRREVGVVEVQLADATPFAQAAHCGAYRPARPSRSNRGRRGGPAPGHGLRLAGARSSEAAATAASSITRLTTISARRARPAWGRPPGGERPCELVGARQQVGAGVVRTVCWRTGGSPIVVDAGGVT